MPGQTWRDNGHKAHERDDAFDNAFDVKRWHQYERGVFVVKNDTQHSNIADIAVCDVARCLNTGATRPRLDV